ncbi:hypothetical protein ACTFIW_011116 [Dictyostelium discoideum]
MKNNLYIIKDDDKDNDNNNCELEKKNLKSIKEIAKSYCIEIKEKENMKKNIERKENTNSFNKIIKLTITDNIEPIEILFWKLFRNKAIYKKIFSFMYNQYSFSYDSVSSLTKLLDSNQISILKRKSL